MSSPPIDFLAMKLNKKRHQKTKEKVLKLADTFGGKIDDLLREMQLDFYSEERSLVDLKGRDLANYAFANILMYHAALHMSRLKGVYIDKGLDSALSDADLKNYAVEIFCSLIDHFIVSDKEALDQYLGQFDQTWLLEKLRKHAKEKQEKIKKISEQLATQPVKDNKEQTT